MPVVLSPTVKTVYQRRRATPPVRLLVFHLLAPRPTGDCTSALSGLDVFDQQHECQVVDPGRFEPVVGVEAGGLRVFGVDQDQPQPGEFSYFERFEEEVLEQRRGEALTLVVAVDGQTTEEHCGQRVGLVPGRACSGLCTGHHRRGRGVETDHPSAVRNDPGPARTFSLIAWRPTLDPVVERLVATVEPANIMRSSQQLWPLIWGHPESSTDPLASNAAIFGLAVAGRWSTS